MNHIQVGELGEAAAADYLQAKGYRLLDRRYRSRTGEIDIVAVSEAGVLVFVEVKTRRSTAYGFPAEAVTYQKQQKIIKTALCFLQQHNQGNVPCRFDVIEVQIDAGNTLKYNHIINAFGR
ncbi:MAG: YraN family protein [Veillonellales bacterium]